jgi:glycosyltransferase involved in cell wall biosynthesis
MPDARQPEHPSAPMRIAIPILGFGRSGGNRVLSRFASEWVRAGHEVTFLAHRAGELPYFPTEAGCIWLDDDGRASAAPGGPSTSRRLAGAAGVARNVRALRAGLGRHAASAHVVLANHALTAWSVAAARVQGRRFYYVQAYEPELYDRGGVAQALLASAASASYRLPLTRIVNAPLYTHYRNLRARHVVPPGLDFAQYYPADTARDPHRPFVIGTIGRREPWKGTRQVLEAFGLLSGRRSDVLLRVAYGNIEWIPRPEGAIEVVVPANDGELADYYRSLDVLVAPGLSQLGAPHYPVLEAMACGVPVVTTGYMPANDQNSWLVPVGDVEAIVRAIEQVIDEPAERGARVRRALHDVRPFAWPVLAQRMLAIFDGRD